MKKIKIIFSKKNKRIILFVYFLGMFFVFGVFLIFNAENIFAASLPDATASDIISGITEAGGIVQCGRPGQPMCTLCDLIRGFNIIIQYIMKIAIGIALLAMAIGGVMYTVSAGDTGLIDKAKSAIKNAAIGFVIIFAAYLIINTTIVYLGTTATLGQNITTSWGTFDCTARESTATNAATNAATNNSTLRENDPCVIGQAPYCINGLICTGGKCIPDAVAIATCRDPKTQWVKTSDCSSNSGVNLADWDCTACKGQKPGSDYKCCGNINITSTVTIVQGGCCVGPKGSNLYTMCSDGQSSNQYNCEFLTNSGTVPGDYFANKKCVDVVVNGNKRKACQ